jgi:hypothetical protein
MSATTASNDNNKDGVFNIFMTACEAAMEKHKTSSEEDQLAAYESIMTKVVEKCNDVCEDAVREFTNVYRTASKEFLVKSNEIEADFDNSLLKFPEWDAKKKCDAAYEAAEKKDENACQALLKGEITRAERDPAERERKEAHLAKYKCDIAYNAAFLTRKKEDDYKAAEVERDNAYKAPREKRDAVIKAAKDKRNAVFKSANKEQDETITAIITLRNAFIENNGA